MKLASKLCWVGLSKKLLYGGIGLALAGVLAACAPASEKVRAPAEEAKLKPQYGGTFVMRAGGSENPAFDSRRSAGGGQMNQISSLVYSGLMRYPFNKVATAAPLECNLCERWEQTNDTTYIFYLRKGVKWHNKPPLNGRELTAEDIRWVLTDGEGYDSKNPLFGGPYRDMTIQYGAKVEAVDRYTVKITLKEPSASFLMDFSHTGFTYSPKEAVEASRTDKNPNGFIGLGLTDVKYAIGTGPFMLKEYTPGVGGTMVRNPDYFRKDADGNQLPYLDEVKVLWILDSKVRTNAMLGGRLHEGGLYLDASDVAKLERAGKFALDVGTGGYWAYMAFNADKPPFNDVRVRRAFHLIVDRFEVMVPANMKDAQVIRWIPSVYEPYGTPMEQVLKLPGYRPDKTQDFEEAKRLLKEAGLEGGFSFVFQARTGAKDVEISTVTQAQLKAFKIDANLDIVDRTTGLQKEYDGVFGAFQYSTAAWPDPSTRLWGHHSKSAKIGHRWTDPKLDALIEKQDRTLDPKERVKVLAQIYDVLDENVPQLTLFFAPWYKAWDKRFHNLIGEPAAHGLTHWVEQVWMEK